MSAIRLARGFTGRETIVKFAGNYHGHADSLLVAAGSSAATLGVPNSPGVTAGTAQRHAGPALQRPGGLGSRLRRAWSADRRRDCRARGRQHGLRAAHGRVPQALREETARHGAMLDLRRGDDRVPRSLGRGPGAVGHSARPDHAGQDHRRRTPGGGLWRSGRDHGPHVAGRQGFSGRHAQRQSPGHGRRHRHVENPPRHATLIRSSSGSPPGWPTGWPPPPTPPVWAAPSAVAGQ